MTPSTVPVITQDPQRIAHPTLPDWEFSGRTLRHLRLKRVFDLFGSFLLLALSSPVFVLLMVCIPLESRGPVFFRSKRRGLNGNTFEVLKFRTMHDDAHELRAQWVGEEENRLLFKIKADPRVTRLGQFLRKFSLDELPQLVNVLRGEMSLIGPRPLLKEDFENARAASPVFRLWVRDRHRLPPGITGLWQVSGRNDLSFDESMQLDLHYVTRWRPGLDLYILVKTPWVVLKGRGAY